MVDILAILMRFGCFLVALCLLPVQNLLSPSFSETQSEKLFPIQLLKFGDITMFRLIVDCIFIAHAQTKCIAACAVEILTLP